jgi:hypothetical protein
MVDAATGEIMELQREGFLDAYVLVTGANLDLALWRAQPDVQQLRPPLPGASIATADFLPDGRIGLDIELPPNGEHQAWAYDPVAARAIRLGAPREPGVPSPNAVAIAPDGARTAAITHLDGLDNAAADQLTLNAPDGAPQTLSSPTAGERLLDASWSPNSDGVLLLSRIQIAGGARFHLRFVAIDGQLRDLAQLPAEPVAASWVWAPDGSSVAFLVRTATTSLVALDPRSGELRYLDDLGTQSVPSSGAIAPAAWGTAGDLLYAGPARPSGDGGAGTQVLYSVAPGRTDAHRLGDVEPVWAPIVQDGEVLLTLARGEHDVLLLRPVDRKGHVLGEQQLGFVVSGAFSARWDLIHRQLLIVRGAPSAGIDVLLARFGLNDPTLPASRPSEQLP